MVSFDSFNLPEPVLRALADMGFTEASPIQAAAIPLLLEGKDMIGQAQTGTGKTAAFGIPLVMAALDGRPSLVLVPTRELAQQVTAEIERIGVHAKVHALALYGGASFGEQARALARAQADILVSTPGRLRDHIERKTLDPSAAKLVVLDEADEMLKMGFVDEVTEILEAVGPDRQTLLFSATMPEGVAHLAKRYLKSPERVVAERKNDSVANANTEQFAVAVEHREKADALIRFLAVERPTGTLVFRHTRETVDELVAELRRKGISAEALHGGLAQSQRDDVTSRLRDGRASVIVATNVAARGLDVDRLSHVVNYDTPRETDAYVHRIGRTGRAGRDGTSLLFVTPGDRSRLRGIERALGGRLTWREVPTDDEVRAAIAKNAGEWVREHLDTPASDSDVAVVDELIAEGRDPRELAATLLGLLAPHEGFSMPKLEPRRAPMRRPQQNDRYERNDRYDNRGAPQRAPQRDAPMVALMLNAGRDDNVRPADIVGALTHEGGLVGAEVGRVDILPRFSVAEIPADRVDDVLDAMARTTIRGRDALPRVAQNWQFRAPPRAAMPQYAR